MIDYKIQITADINYNRFEANRSRKFRGLAYVLGFFLQYYDFPVCMFNVNVSLLRRGNVFNPVRQTFQLVYANCSLFLFFLFVVFNFPYHAAQFDMKI